MGALEGRNGTRGSQEARAKPKRPWGMGVGSSKCGSLPRQTDLLLTQHFTATQPVGPYTSQCSVSSEMKKYRSGPSSLTYHSCLL